MKILIILLSFLCINTIYGQNGNITPETFEEKRNKFASEGFGFVYENDINIFILNHGEPQERTEKIIEEKYQFDNMNKLITLYYSSFSIMFSIREEKNILYSKVESIQSKDNIEYMYGIKNGMTIDELTKIIGELETIENLIYVNKNSIWIKGYNGHIVLMETENNIIKYITWAY